MKNSLYKISVLLFGLLIVSCHSNSKSANHTSKKSNAKSQSTAGGSNSNSGIKDTIGGSVKNTAIIHGNLNQSELDSAKAEKTRKKKSRAN